MVRSEDEKPLKSDDKSILPTAEQQSNVPVYPDWSAMQAQAYYGPRVAFPQFYNSAVGAGHPHPPPPYMWGPPQPMMAPYGTPYAAVYAAGGVYAHPGIPSVHGDGSHSSSAMGESLAGTALSIDTPVKSSVGKTDNGLVKKLKSFEGLTMSIGNGSSEKHEGSSENRSSQSGDSEGSSDGSNGSDGNTEGAEENKRKRSRDDLRIADVSEKPEMKPTAMLDANMCSSGDKVVGVPVSSTVATTLELSNPEMNANAIPAATAPNAIIPFDSRNEREMKKERRKQSNRESARRSRLRKQAETEELAKKVESLTAENMVLKSEINQLVQNSKKLRQDNAELTEKLKTVSHGSLEETGSSKNGGIDEKTTHPLNTENFLSKVNRSSEEGAGGGTDAVNSGKKLHQLLVSNRRADAVAAG